MYPHPTRRAVVLAGAAAALTPTLTAFASTSVHAKEVGQGAEPIQPYAGTLKPGGWSTTRLRLTGLSGTARAIGVRLTALGTCQSAYYVPGLVPEQGEKVARVEVRAVGELYAASDPAPGIHAW